MQHARIQYSKVPLLSIFFPELTLTLKNKHLSMKLSLAD